MIFGEAIGSKKINMERLCIKKYGIKKAKQLILKTGPKKIFLCNNYEDTLTLSKIAWNNLKKKDLNKIQILFYVTETPVKKFPGNGFLFASINKLEKDIQIIDINSGCTGFVDALSLSLSLKKKSIIICSEAYSKNNINFNRSISPIFSDGAAAFIPNLKQIKLIDSEFGYKKNTFDDLQCGLNSNIKMDGKKVYDFVSSEVYPAILRLIKRNKKKKIHRIFIHQGSKFVVDFFKKKLIHLCQEIPSNIEKNGNFVSATIPILISQNLKKKPLKKKENIILCGFGVGLAYSMIFLEINKNK